MLDDKKYYILMEDIWEMKPLSDPKILSGDPEEMEGRYIRT